MDLGCFLKSLEQKSILITGCSGFLAKIFLEKVLRVQPHVKKLFVLLRAEDDASAYQRLQKDVIGKELFRVLRQEYGSNFGSFISKKVTPVAGDITLENLGVKDSNMREELWREISFIVNVAGNTNFNERYDVALSINALGAKHACDFAKKCIKLELLLHVSTAYVARESEGFIKEKPFGMEETYNENYSLDIEEELKLAQAKLKELREEEATDEAIKFAMQELGIQRARLFGWANTYVFTKAMGEMLLGHLREDLPLVIVRPSIITSTIKEPFPGWIEGFRTIDSLIASYGKGKLQYFLADPATIVDAIPGDMVANAMFLTMAAHSCQSLDFIYTVCSSKRNPLMTHDLVDWSYQYFRKNPCVGKDGVTIRVSRGSMLPTKASFCNLMALHYKLPLQVLRIINALSFQYFENAYGHLNRKYNLVMRFVDLYEHFAFFTARFDDSNLERLRMTLKDDSVEAKRFDIDPSCINWEDYFINIHFPGLARYLIK